MNRTISSLILLCTFFLLNMSYGQLPQTHQNNLKMVVDGDTLLSAWGGGMNAPQFSAVDFDKDGKLDMLVFDRQDNSFATYLNVGGKGDRVYQYAPQYESRFEQCECTNWALAADYNCDGRMDIVCGDNSYIDAYKQVEKDGEIYFESDYQNISSTFISGFFLRIFCASTDLPAIVDVDDDGDMDILTWKLGANNIEWHRNYGLEELGRCDTLYFKEEAACYGHFSEDLFSNNINLHDTTRGCEPGNFSPEVECSGFMMRRANRLQGISVNDGRHIGSTTLAIDVDGDDVKDMLIGDVSFNNINMVHNCGRLDYAYMDSVDEVFPSYDKPINMGLFPAAFYVDVDNDDIRDLIVATNYTGRAENKYSTQLYLNKGQDNYPDFKYKGRAFMQEDNIDQGSAAAPAFLDYNQDGLPDLVVGDGGIYDTLTKEMDYRLMLYENVGNRDVPMFKLVDDDYLSFGGGNRAGARLSPAVGDLNGDGDDDLLIGTADGTIMYFENTAGAGNVAQFSLVNAMFEGIDIGANAAPFLYDFDKDLDPDLFIGGLRGQIAFYENTGTSGSFAFTEVSQKFGFIEVTDQFGNVFSGNAKPIIVDYDNDNEVEMLIGNIRGEIEVFENLAQGLTDTLPLSAVLFDYDFGSYAAPAVAVIDSTGDPTFIVGIERGGMKLFNSLPAQVRASVSVDPEILSDLGISFYPNPARNGIWVELDKRQNKAAQLTIINTLGQQIARYPLPGRENYIPLDHLTAGMYLLRFEAGGQGFVRKLIKE